MGPLGRPSWAKLAPKGVLDEVWAPKSDSSKVPRFPQENHTFWPPGVAQDRPRSAQDRLKIVPRRSREYFFSMLLFGVDFGAFGGRFGVSLGCLWGLFWRPLALKIGAKFDQKIVDNKNRPKMTPRESKSPPGTPQGRPRNPPRSTPGAPKLAKY